MRVEHIPHFIDKVMEQIEDGVERVTKRARTGENPGVVKYPEVVEIQLDIEWHELVNDGTQAGYSEITHHQCWVKIPWPKS